MTSYQQTAFDAIRANAHFIPRSPSVPFAVAGYINGAITEFQWTQAEWDMFPESYHIRLNVTGDPHRGNGIDVENGDATPADVQPWIETRHAEMTSSDPLLVYCNGSNLNACVAARDAAQRAVGVYAFIWEATLDGTLSGRAMTQYGQLRDSQGTAVADMSLITDARLIAAMAAVLAAA